MSSIDFMRQAPEVVETSSGRKAKLVRNSGSHLFKPGHPKPPGSGRKKGQPNKITKELKEMILGALDDAGGQKYLTEQAHSNPKAFLALVGRVLPMTVQGTGEKGGLVIEVVTGINRER